MVLVKRQTSPLSKGSHWHRAKPMKDMKTEVKGEEVSATKPDGGSQQILQSLAVTLAPRRERKSECRTHCGRLNEWCF